MLEQEKKYIEKAQKGDKEAFGLLYDHYLPPIFRFISFKTSSKDEAEDLTHEVFMSAWKNIGNYKYEGFPFSSWLYQIAKNQVIDSYRTAKKNLSLDAPEAILIKTNSVTEEKLDETMELNRVRDIISTLKPIHQEVILMRFVEELSHEEIADNLKKSPGAVRLIQHRALKELKSLYEKNYNGTIV